MDFRRNGPELAEKVARKYRKQRERVFVLKVAVRVEGLVGSAPRTDSKASVPVKAASL